MWVLDDKPDNIRIGKEESDYTHKNNSTFGMFVY